MSDISLSSFVLLLRAPTALMRSNTPTEKKKSSAKHRSHAAPSSLPLHRQWHGLEIEGCLRDRQTASSTHGHSTAVLSGQQALGQDPAASSHTHTAPEELRIAPRNSFPTGEWIANRRQHIKRFHPSLSFFSCRVLSIT